MISLNSSTYSTCFAFSNKNSPSRVYFISQLKTITNRKSFLVFTILTIFRLLLLPHLQSSLFLPVQLNLSLSHPLAVVKLAFEHGEVHLIILYFFGVVVFIEGTAITSSGGFSKWVFYSVEVIIELVEIEASLSILNSCETHLNYINRTSWDVLAYIGLR